MFPFDWSAKPDTKCNPGSQQAQDDCNDFDEGGELSHV